MIRTQVYITEKERAALTKLKQQTGRSQSELIRSAIDHFCQMLLQPQDRLQVMRRAKGLWKDRDDAPNIQTLRDEWDRSFGDDDR